MITLLKLKRTQLDMGQLELAQKCNMLQCRVSLLERGLVMPSPEEAESIGKVLGLNPDKLQEDSRTVKVEVANEA